MLSKEENELLTHVGPGTPMGDLLRQYWLPVMFSWELSEPDCDPVRFRLLCEDLIAFRDTHGRVGLLANHCSHRGASLFYGRNEQGGLRCVYHGWKYDVAGNCVDMPNEPPESNFKDKIHHPAYPCVERGGLVWTYMGPRADPPGFPDFEWVSVPENQRSVPYKVLRECNWVQALEGDIDTSHLYILHSRLNPDDPPSYGVYHPDRHPHLELVHTDLGLAYGARRQEADGTYYWRISQFMMPIFTLFPAYGSTVPGHMWVPMDDERTMVWDLRWDPLKPLPEATTVRADAAGRASLGEFLPATSEAGGRWHPRANRGNDHLLDREAQRTKSFTGLPSIPLQDTAVQESMGSILDRTVEHLGTSDAAVIQMRRRLIDAAMALREHGVTPPGVDEPERYRARSASVSLPSDANWLEATRGWLEARADLPSSAAS